MYSGPQLTPTSAYTGNLQGSEATAASPIRDSITGAEQLLSDVHQSIDLLEKRLDTLLTPVAPTPPAQINSRVAATGGPSSHVLGRMSILNEGYQHAITRMRELHNRIEL